MLNLNVEPCVYHDIHVLEPCSITEIDQTDSDCPSVLGHKLIHFNRRLTKIYIYGFFLRLHLISPFQSEKSL